MTFGLGEFGHLFNVCKGLAKVGKSEGPLDASGLVTYFPLWNVEMKVFGLLRA
jgi:hypothetical protein